MFGSRCFAALLLVCGLGSARSQFVNPIRLPSEHFGLTSVDTSDKNSGSQDAQQDGSGMGYINYQPIAPNKGLHLSTAAASIRAVNATAAMALQSAAATPAGKQSAFTGQDTFTQTLAPQLTYHGGKMMVSPKFLNVYLIFYGRWRKMQRRTIAAFVTSLDSVNSGGLKSYPTVAGWWRINYAFYSDKKKMPTTLRVRVAGVLNDQGSMYPFGSSMNPLTHDHIRLIVQRATNARRRNHFPLDPNGAYAVLTGEDVYAVDFCQGLCAYHTSATMWGMKLAYTFVGNPATQCPMMCTYQYFDPMFKGPNGDLGADACSDKLGHELAELATNTLHGPRDLPGWCVSNSVVENADLCEWEYGNVTFERDMTVWNMRGIQNRRYLVQLNFNRVAQKCVLQYNSP